jgi:hypothetical protein
VFSPLARDYTDSFRYVDDTLVLDKPSDIHLILNKLKNNYNPDIQFTHEEFIVKNDVDHFLDINLASDGTTMFPKYTLTFTPWSCKIAWEELTKFVATVLYFQIDIETILTCSQ